MKLAIGFVDLAIYAVKFGPFFLVSYFCLLLFGEQMHYKRALPSSKLAQVNLRENTGGKTARYVLFSIS